jgi:glycosyltransferase involved in cell wall biosynthesis
MDRDRPDGALQYTFTIFTPTYNRAHTLHRVYDSVRSQTFHDFEWLICDDGSTDETPRLVERWMREAPFAIRYVRQEHHGKHVAFNRGVREARGALFLGLDSDDACVPDALDRFKRHWDAIPASDRHRFSAVTALCQDQHGRLVGDRFPRDPTDSDSLEIRYRFRVKGEKWGFQRTAVLRDFAYPVWEGETHVPPSFVWRAIARRYKTRYVNEILRIYHVDERADQLSALGSRLKHAGALAAWYRYVLTEELDWFPVAPVRFLAAAVNHVRFSLHARRRPAAPRSALRGRARLLGLLALPVGIAVYARDRLVVSSSRHRPPTTVGRPAWARPTGPARPLRAAREIDLPDKILIHGAERPDPGHGDDGS